MNEPRKFTIVCPPTYFNKIGVIKAFRVLTGLGLKESKDAVEVVGKPQTFDITSSLWASYVNPEAAIEEQFTILRAEKVEVGPPVHKLLDELRKLGSQALLQGEDNLANEILQLVLAEKLRRPP